MGPYPQTNSPPCTRTYVHTYTHTHTHTHALIHSHLAVLVEHGPAEEEDRGRDNYDDKRGAVAPLARSGEAHAVETVGAPAVRMDR